VPIPASEAETIERQVAGIGDSELRAALAELGRAILANPEHEG
jgi:hypothetical protein